ncbi:acyl carrier protein [Sinorhizobium sp. 7-81]|uniref:acyl carrier protein n=1 Tax=unclassified Sinorhizobium TaxID=2613772 RepID=UPI0024C2972F|nr:MULTISPECIES: acyl carrier protein [unclassified Sinorhizobium]MDK1389247.1 acyl carrier protein [Sinorhizobium sp. 7-81]MDK1494670.1 acyl carrier protein [Sinorhizobium sp. 8-89]
MPDQLVDDVIAMIKNRVASNGADVSPGLSGNEITAASELTSLGVDSLGLADILWDLEQSYGIRIELNTAEAWSNLQNVGDVVEAVRRLLAEEV